MRAEPAAPKTCMHGAPRGQHGGRLFYGALAQGLLSAAQRRGVSNRLLLRIPLFLACRGWRMEPRSATSARVRIHPIGEPGLSIIGHRTLARLGCSICHPTLSPSTCRVGQLFGISS
jgi:hypothetical protein